jgi:hypothetical protein
MNFGLKVAVTLSAIFMIIGCKPSTQSENSSISSVKHVGQSNSLSIFTGEYKQVDGDGKEFDGAAHIKITTEVKNLKIVQSAEGEPTSTIFKESVDGKQNEKTFTVSSSGLGGLVSQITKRIVTKVVQIGNVVVKLTSMYSRPFGHVWKEWRLYKKITNKIVMDRDNLTYEINSSDDKLKTYRYIRVK